MSEMKVYDGATWDGSFTIKTYGLDDDGAGSAAAFNTFTGVAKVYVNGVWTIFYPLGADGESAAVNLLNWTGDTTQALNVEATADISYSFLSNGLVELSKNLAPAISSLNNPGWISSQPSAVGADYEMAATVTSGTTPTHSLSALDGITYTTMTSARSFSLSQVASGTATCTLSIKIRKIATPAEEIIEDLTLTATNSF